MIDHWQRPEADPALGRDGDPGTVLVKDIRLDASGSSFPSELTEVDGTLYFTAWDDAHGEELWSSR